MEEDFEYVGFTVEQLIETGAQFDYGLALDLMKDGHFVKRFGDNSNYVYTLHMVDSDGDKDKESMFVTFEPNEGKVVSYKTFTTEELLAEDWYVVR